MFTLLPVDVQNAIGRTTSCKVQYRDMSSDDDNVERVFNIILYSEPSKELVSLVTDKYGYNGIYLKSSITNKHGIQFAIAV